MTEMIRSHTMAVADNMFYTKQPKTSPSSRILDIPCKVCGDYSSGKHYGIYACDGCAGFFKRTIRKHRTYECKSKKEGSCPIDKAHRNQCRACRIAGCLEAGMNKDAVQHERGPRASTRIKNSMAAMAGEVSGLPSFPPPPPLPFGVDAILGGYHPLLPVNPGLSRPLMPYPILTPPLLPYQQAVRILEVTATLHMRNLDWAKSVPEFMDMSHQDRMLLLDNSWCSMFILSLSQHCLKLFPNYNFKEYLRASGILSREMMLSSLIQQEMDKLQGVLIDLGVVRTDITEFAFLRALMLFKPVIGNLLLGAGVALSEASATAVSSLHEKHQLALKQYLLQTKPTAIGRYDQLVALMPKLRTVSSIAIEEVFFRCSIGEIPMSQVMSRIIQNVTP